MPKFTLLIAALLLALCGSAQTVEVLGTVTDAETDRRLDRARVRVFVDDNLVSNYITSGRNGTFELRLPGAENRATTERAQRTIN